MRAAPAMAAVLLLPLGVVAAQRARTPPRSWIEPECFAYSPSADGYACVDFELASDDEGRRGVAEVRDVARWTQRTRAAWGGRRGAALVTSDSGDAAATTFLPIVEREYALEAPLRRVRSAARVRALVARAGYDHAVDARVELEPGLWRSIAGAALRFETASHEGDASAYAIGHLHLRCPGPSGPEIDVLRGRPRGGAAFAFHADGAPSIALTTVETGGGEGAGYIASRTIVVDLDETCAGPPPDDRGALPGP